MNSLSWLLIIINLIDNAKNFTIAITLLTGGFFILWMFFAHASAAAHNDGVFKYTQKISHKDRFDQYKKFFWFPFIFGLVNIVIPDTRTMYLVAASEIGEKVATSETVAGLVDPTIDILKNYITLENEKIQNELKKVRETKK